MANQNALLINFTKLITGEFFIFKFTDEQTFGPCIKIFNAEETISYVFNLESMTVVENGIRKYVISDIVREILEVVIINTTITETPLLYKLDIFESMNDEEE